MSDGLEWEAAQRYHDLRVVAIRRDQILSGHCVLCGRDWLRDQPEQHWRIINFWCPARPLESQEAMLQP